MSMKSFEQASVWLLRIVAVALLGMIVTRITTTYRQPQKTVQAAAAGDR